MKNLKLDIGLLKDHVTQKDLKALQSLIANVTQSIYDKTCAGNDFLGWVDLPDNVSLKEIEDIESIAQEIKDNADHVICIGIGGSYLGARATIDFLSEPLTTNNKVLYLGHNLSADYMNDLIDFIQNKKCYVNVISKSGTTTEPGVAFRILLDALKSGLSKAEFSRRVVATTDQSQGALRTMADAEGFRSFVIPDDVGGRFSVLTPVGLLPIAAAGYDVDALLAGAKDAAAFCRNNQDVLGNPVLTYAAARYLLYKSGKTIEVLSAFDPSLQYVGEWWKQLYGESEGKDGKGIFPASTVFTTDLHSMGQYIQDGERNLFETFLTIENMRTKIAVPKVEENLDGMNFLAGMDLSDVNYQAYRGTALAHAAGNVPNMNISLADRTEYTLGQLFYFFEFAVAVSGLLLEINPFDQPGVEAYKQNMFALLGKPGFEDRRKELLGK